MFARSIRSSVVLAALLVAAAAFPAHLRAQQRVTDDRGNAGGPLSVAQMSAPLDTILASSAAGPRIAPAGFNRHVSAELPGPARPYNDTRPHDNRNVAMMGVGAAAVGLGLIIGGGGGTAIAVTGGVVGLVGLYRYLR